VTVSCISCHETGVSGLPIDMTSKDMIDIQIRGQPSESVLVVRSQSVKGEMDRVTGFFPFSDVFDGEVG
jgi:hypothetical protein